VGIKSLLKEVTTITNLSNHIPIFTRTEIIQITKRLVLNFLIQKS